MSLVAALTSAPTVGEQFGRLVGMVVLLVVIAYAAAGLSLLVGSPQRPASGGDRLYGAGALAACALLLFSSPWPMLAGALATAALVWIAWRLTGARRPPPATTDASADG
jgi:arginine:agmatine antiporter